MPRLTLPTTPELATALRDVWSAGGWPLASMFVVALLGVILVGGSDATPADRKKDIESLSSAVGTMIREVTDARNALRMLPQPPENVRAKNGAPA